MRDPARDRKFDCTPVRSPPRAAAKAPRWLAAPRGAVPLRRGRCRAPALARLINESLQGYHELYANTYSDIIKLFFNTGTYRSSTEILSGIRRELRLITRLNQRSARHQIQED